MWFILGIMLGSSGHGENQTPPFISGIPMECILAETEILYQACRLPSFEKQTADVCDDNSNAKAYYARRYAANILQITCDFQLRSGWEWYGLEKLNKLAANRK